MPALDLASLAWSLLPAPQAAAPLIPASAAAAAGAIAGTASASSSAATGAAAVAVPGTQQLPPLGGERHAPETPHVSRASSGRIPSVLCFHAACALDHGRKVVCFGGGFQNDLKHSLFVLDVGTHAHLQVCSRVCACMCRHARASRPRICA